MDEGVTFTARAVAVDGAQGVGRRRRVVLRDPAGRPRRRGARARRRAAGLRLGAGARPVGATTWDTSVFPDAGSGSFVLPVKKAVRTAAGVAEGDLLTVTLSVRDAA